MQELMSTKEVATYLGIHEKQVYVLAKRGTIPCTRVTGKWLFPKKLIDAWIEDSAKKSPHRHQQEERPFLLAAGSDDPSLGALRECYTSRLTPTVLFLATVGSRAGLEALRDGVADVALAHLVDLATGEYNLPYLQQFLPMEVAVVTLFHRELGLVVPPGNPLGLRTVADLGRYDVCLINRQEGSGTRWYLDQELRRLGLEAHQLNGYYETVSTHLEVGLRVLRREVDTGIATHATARLLGLDFVPLTLERFDMLIPHARFFLHSMQTLLDVVGSREFRRRVEVLGGYDTSESGRLRMPQ
jgi:putative molybdopterin biosynthesis protein